MSTITKEDVAKIARLARIKVDEDKMDALGGELTKIMHWVEQLSEVDTDNVAPMASVVDAKLVWRDDVVNDGNRRDDVLANAPISEYGFFAVPKVIE